MAAQHSTPQHDLYAADISLYSGKARSYLRYKGIAFNEVFPSLSRYKRFIIPRTGVRFIPVLHSKTDDLVVQDTTEIVDFLEARHADRSIEPPGGTQRLVAALLEAYGDEWLLIPAMHYRWKYIAHHDDVLEGFGEIVLPRAPRFVRKIIGKRVSAPFKGALPYLGIHPETEHAVEQSYEALLADLNAHFARHDYLLGNRASRADFGFIAPLYAHLGRDAYPKALMERIAPNVYRWVLRMNSETPRMGDWPDNDAIPDTLLPVLKRLFAEQAPVMRDTIAAVAKWSQGQPAGTRIPRGIGEHDFQLEGVKAQREIIPYAQWMWQRAVDAYTALDDTARPQADALLETVGGTGYLDQPIPARVIRENNRLLLA